MYEKLQCCVKELKTASLEKGKIRKLNKSSVVWRLADMTERKHTRRNGRYK